jgi:hypothetical protein
MKKKLSLTRIFNQRDKLFLALRPFIDKSIVSETLRDLTQDVYRVLPPHISHDAVFESCRTLAGCELERKAAAEFAWRLAGNIDVLSAGNPVIPWSRQCEDEWMPVQVMRVDHARRRNRSGYSFQLRVQAGSACPLLFDHFMSKASCAAIANIVGFSRNNPYTNSAYFTNLRFWVLAEAAKSAESIYFHRVDCSPAMQAHNKKIIAIRTRTLPCPSNFDHPCERCVVGYDTCQAALFAKQLIKNTCKNCSRENYFDTTRSTEVCVVCWAATSLLPTAGS